MGGVSLGDLDVLLGRNSDLSLFVTPVSPQALLEGRTMASFKKNDLGKIFCFISVVFVYFLEPSSLHILRKLYGQATIFQLLFSGSQMATL